MSKLDSHENKMLNLTTQMRQNQEDLSSFLKDLDSWESDIKTKDDTLKKQKTVEELKLPPVRNSLDKKKKKVKKKESLPKSRRIKGYDYRAWDKFDVDKACDEVGEAGEKSGSSSEYETDEEWEVERRKQGAIMEKDKGNDYFKRGDLENAIECYTRGADLDPTNPLLPANRAMALLKQEKFAAAEVDSTVSLSLDPVYTKAYLRRASARVGLKKFPEAKQDYERVLQLEPQNKKAKLELENIEKELAKENLVTHTELTSSSEAGIVKAVFKAPQERSKKPLRKIHIEEVGVEEDAGRKSAILKVEQGQGQMKKQLVEKDSEMFQKFTATSPADIGAMATGGSKEVTEVEHDSSLDSETRTHGDEQASILKVSEMALDKPESNTVSRTVIQDRDSSAKTEQATKAVSQEKARQVTPTSSPRELPVPLSSFQFQADYKVLKNNPEAFYRYFKRILPDQYPKLFGSSLDAEVLLKILAVFRDLYILNNEDFFEHLKFLTGVQRFSMTVMFFSPKEKQVVKDLMQHLLFSGEHSSAEVDELAKQYDLR